MREAVIVSTARTGLAKSFRGGFNNTEAPAMGGHVVRAAVERAGIDPAEVDDCIFGAAAQQGTQGYNIGRLCGIAGGLPETVAGMSMDRQCSSGLMSIATAAKSIICNDYDIAVAGGVESISLVQTKHKNTYKAVSETVTAIDPTAYMPMLETAEVVSDRYNISRESQDEYSLQSQQRVAAARRRCVQCSVQIIGAANPVHYAGMTRIGVQIEPAAVRNSAETPFTVTCNGPNKEI